MLLGILVFFLLVGILGAYVMLPVLGDLTAARDLLSRPATELTSKEAERVNRLLDNVHGRVTSLPARLIGWIPIVSANLDAIEVASARIPDVVQRGLELRDAADRIASDGLLRKGRVDTDVLAPLVPALQAERDALTSLRSALEDKHNGKLAPQVWDAVDDLLYEVGEVEDDVRALQDLLASSGALLGEDGKRTYLILLMNNAELRGAGGILTGIGEITADDGRIQISDFKSIHKLRTQRKNKVPVPEDFERFRIYGANDTSLFLNTTYSPDVPDVAVVASRLYEEITGTKTDGAMVVDPRGIAALMPREARIEVPDSDIEVTADRLPEFVYSDAYEEFTDQDRRRNAILDVGQRAFELILDAGLGGEDGLERTADAFAAGHIRFVSFDDSEKRALEAANATGDVEPAVGDSLLVAVQNRGGRPGIGSKLDFWERRSIDHDCRVWAEYKKVDCTTSVVLRNAAPRGLPAYVTGSSTPYARMHSFVEVFIPAEAEITGVTRDGAEPGVVLQEQADRVSVGLSVVVDRGESTRVEVGYTLPYRRAYSLIATPQPLANDADIDIALSVPRDWTVRGPGEWEDNTFRHRASFTETISINAAPPQRSGLPALWDSLTEFWNEPVF